MKGSYKISPICLSVPLPILSYIFISVHLSVRNYVVDFFDFLHESILP